jgi:CheY-like chemotaxis protein
VVHRIDTILLVDASRVARMFLERILRVHCERVLVADTASAAIDLAHAGAVSLVLADLDAAAAGDFRLLRDLRGPADPPAALLIASREPADAERRCAEALGAIGFLRPPIRVRDILSMWERATTFTPGRAGERVRIDLDAVLRLADADGEPVAAGSTHDLGVGGVFVATEGPLPVGTRVTVELAPCCGQHIVATGRVIRVQEPSWLHRGGVAIQFDSGDAALREQLAAVLGAGDPVSRARAGAR